MWPIFIRTHTYQSPRKKRTSEVSHLYSGWPSHDMLRMTGAIKTLHFPWIQWTPTLAMYSYAGGKAPIPASVTSVQRRLTEVTIGQLFQQPPSSPMSFCIYISGSCYLRAFRVSIAGNFGARGGNSCHLSRWARGHVQPRRWWIREGTHTPNVREMLPGIKGEEEADAW